MPAPRLAGFENRKLIREINRKCHQKSYEKNMNNDSILERQVNAQIRNRNDKLNPIPRK